MQVKIKRLTDDAIIPTYATDGSGCFDIYTTSDSSILVWSNTFDTALSFEIPEGYVMLVFSRSGHGFKNDVRLANCVGVIDSDFRGELKIKLSNDSMVEGFQVNKGDRIAQGLIIPYPKVQFVEVEELAGSVRGNGGFGSTGR